MSLKFGRAENSNDQICPKGFIAGVDFVIHVMNILPEEYGVILDGLENCLTANGDNVLTIEVICRKVNHHCKKIEMKIKKKEEKGLRSP